LPRQRVAARREVALVEHEVQRREHHGDPVTERVGPWDRDRDRRLTDLALRTREPLRHGRLGFEERPGDLSRGEPAERPKRQRHLRLARERGVAAREHQREPVVGVVVHRVTLRHRPSRSPDRREIADIPPRLGLEDGELVGVPAISPQTIDRAVASRRRDPRTGVVRRAAGRPLLERNGERLLHGFLGQVDVADRARDGRDRPPGLAPEHAVDDVGAALR
jgi:hypothetical protein